MIHHFVDPNLLGWRLTRVVERSREKLIRINLPIIKNSLRKRSLKAMGSPATFKLALNKAVGVFDGFSNIVAKKQSCDLIKRADQILKGEYDLLGSGLIKTKPISWSKDYISGYTWQTGIFYRSYKQVDLSNNADVKWPRELSRCHQCLYLGQAYLLTKDASYALELIGLIDSWIDDNPLMYSINWGCAMDVAIRAVNWIYALAMVTDSESVSPDFWKKVNRSLYEHGFFLSMNLERGLRNTHNHYLSDLAGLVYLGYIYRDDSEAKKWLDFSVRELFHEIRGQVLPCGASYERSTNYHRLSLELALYTCMFLESKQFQIPLDVKFRLKSMIIYTDSYLKPDGNVPIVGDQDDGRFLPFGIYGNLDHRYLCSIGEKYFRHQFRNKLTDHPPVEIFFLGLQPGDSSDLCTTSCNGDEVFYYPDAGICIMKTARSYILVSNGGATTYPDQAKITGSHAHADLMSLVYMLDGNDFFIDPGTYTYSRSAELRNKFRSSSVHNVAIVDDTDQFEYYNGEIFNVKRPAKPLDFIFKEDSSKFIIIGSHDAYDRLPDPVKYQRTISLDKEDEVLEVWDSFEADKLHDYKIVFHLSPSVVTYLNGTICRLSSGKTNLQLSIVLDQDYSISIVDSFASKAYGHMEPSKLLLITIPRSRTVNVHTIINEVH